MAAIIGLEKAQKRAAKGSSAPRSRAMRHTYTAPPWTAEDLCKAPSGKIRIPGIRPRRLASSIDAGWSGAGQIGVDLGGSRFVLVRRAKIEDDRAMALIMAAVAQEGLIGAEPPVDIKARARRFRDAIEAEGSGACWVLDDAGRVAGSADVQERAPGVLYLGMAILPDARGRGGGRALLDAILEHAHACGAHKVELEVWVDNARAIALYASAGFEVEGVRRNHYRRRGGGLRSALLMARLIALVGQGA